MGITKDPRQRGVYERETYPASQQGNVSRTIANPQSSANYEEVVLRAAGPAGLGTYEWILQYRSEWRYFLSVTHARRMSAKAAAKRWETFATESGLRDSGFVHVQGRQASGNPDHHCLVAGKPDLKKIRKAWKGRYGGSIYLEPIRNIEGAAAYICTRNRHYLPIVEMQ